MIADGDKCFIKKELEKQEIEKMKSSSLSLGEPSVAGSL
jgi:hypothetical protein